MAFLVLNSRTGTVKPYEVGDRDLIIGRHPTCDIFVDLSAVSRRHARVSRIDGKLCVEDLQSRNGTYVNEEKILQPHILGPGDRIRVCDVVLNYYPDKPTAVTPGSSDMLLVDDDPDDPSSTIIKLDASSDRAETAMIASAEAKLEAIIEIIHNLRRSLELDQVLPQLLEGLFKIFMQADRGFIVLRDNQGKLVPQWGKQRGGTIRETIRISRTIVKSVMGTKQAILSTDAADDSRFGMSQSVADVRIRSMMCAPLLAADGTAFGVLQIDMVDQWHRFGEADLDVLVAIAAQAAVAIENARLTETMVKQRKLERELEIARRVQEKFLPRSHPKQPECRFFDFYRPADQVGGDYYDYLPLSDGRLAIVVADVSGHGISAALMTAKLSSTIRFCIGAGYCPADSVTDLNSTLMSDDLDDHFITLLMMVLDPTSQRMTLVSAGHMLPIWRKANGELFEPPATSGLPLMVSAGEKYKQVEAPLDPGDLVVAYTDGIYEAVDDKGKQFSIERMESLIQSLQPDVEQTSMKVIDDVLDFVGAEPISDDMCLVCLEWLGGR